MIQVKVLLATAYVVYVVLLAYVLLTPGPVGPSEVVGWLDSLLRGVGVDIGTRWAEFVMNIVLFVPMGLLGVWLFDRTRPGDWTAVAFVLATGVEVAQRYLLPTRSGEARDVVANTAGALLGALVGRGLLVLSRRAPARPRRGSPR